MRASSSKEFLVSFPLHKHPLMEKVRKGTARSCKQFIYDSHDREVARGIKLDGGKLVIGTTQERKSYIILENKKVEREVTVVKRREKFRALGEMKNLKRVKQCSCYP